MDWEDKWKQFKEGNTLAEGYADPVSIEVINLFLDTFCPGLRRLRTGGTLSTELVTFYIENKKFVPVRYHPFKPYSLSLSALKRLFPKERAERIYSSSEEKELCVKKSEEFLERNYSKILSFFEDNGYYVTTDEVSAYKVFVPAKVNEFSSTELLEKTGGYAYHYSPAVYDQSILTKGIEPRTGVSVNFAEPRVYLWSGKDVDSGKVEGTVLNTIALLMTRRPERVNKVTQFKVNLKKLKDFQFYPDQEFTGGKVNPAMYVTKTIPPDAIEDVHHFDISNLNTDDWEGVSGEMVRLDEYEN